MRLFLSLGILGALVSVGIAQGDDGAQTGPEPATAEPVQGPKAEEAKLLSAVREALERNTQEIKGLKERYAKDMEQQQKTVTAQQKEIEQLKAQVLKQAPAGAAAPPADQGGPEPPRQEKVSDLQQKQIEVLNKQVKLLKEQLEKQGPVVEKVEAQVATQEVRAKQAAERDRQLAYANDSLQEIVDEHARNIPPVPAPVKELFLPSGTNVTPISIFNTLSMNYNVFQNRKGAGTFEFMQYTPFFLVTLNKRIFLSAQPTFTQNGVFLNQAQVDFFINNWLMMDAGYFLAPIGFWNEALEPQWINKLPDDPLVMQNVIPAGLALQGIQFRGSKYIGRSPIKLLYAAYATNGLGVPGAGKAANWLNRGQLIGTTANFNEAMAYGGRIGLWLPRRGINFGVSEFVNAPYSTHAGAVQSVWQPYFNYHYGNFDFRFEYGNNYLRTRPFIGNNIDSRGLFAQIAYRDYASLHKHLQRLEYVFRFSDAFFSGIDQSKVNPASYFSPVAAPLDRNQYTLGVNYYLYASTVFKLAYEFNDELHRPLRDNLFMAQFATNF